MASKTVKVRWGEGQGWLVEFGGKGQRVVDWRWMSLGVVYALARNRAQWPAARWLGQAEVVPQLARQPSGLPSTPQTQPNKPQSEPANPRPSPLYSWP